MKFFSLLLAKRRRNKLLERCQEWMVSGGPENSTESLAMIYDLIPRFIAVRNDLEVKNEKLVRLTTGTRSLADLSRRAEKLFRDLGTSSAKQRFKVTDRSLYDFFCIGETGDLASSLIQIRLCLNVHDYRNVANMVDSDSLKNIDDNVKRLCHDVLVFIYTYTKNSEIVK